MAPPGVLKVHRSVADALAAFAAARSRVVTELIHLADEASEDATTAHADGRPDDHWVLCLLSKELRELAHKMRDAHAASTRRTHATT